MSTLSNGELFSYLWTVTPDKNSSEGGWNADKEVDGGAWNLRIKVLWRWRLYRKSSIQGALYR